MKRMFLGITVAALFAAALPSTASAQGYKGGQYPSLDWVLYNGTVAAADAAISVGPLDTSMAESVTFELQNGGAGARSAIVECWDPSNTVTTRIFTAVSVAATDASTIWVSPLATGTAPAKHTFVPIQPCHRMSVRAAAATGTVRVVVLKRTGK